jgi:hypothetical protein
MAENNEENLISFLKEHSDKEFVRRILDPSLNTNPVKNSTGTTSTHSMAAEQDKEGNWYVFPTVVNQGGKLVRYDDSFAAMDENFKTGEYISFGKDGNSATKFAAGGYKTKEFKDYRQPVTGIPSNNSTSLFGGIDFLENSDNIQRKEGLISGMLKAIK